MSALLRRLRPGRRAPEATPEEETRVLPASADADAEAGAPAGVSPDDLAGERPDTRRRGRLRRRLRHLRQIRELMLRDLGGIAYELHRAPEDEGEGVRAQGVRVMEGKLERLAALDAERRELEVALGDVRAETVLRESGVGGACPACGEYFASDAHFCANCGTRVDGRAPAPPAPGHEIDAAQPAPPEAEPVAAEPGAPAPVEEPVGEVRS